MSALDGFNIVKYQVFTFKMNDKGEAIDKDGNLVTDSSKLVLFGKDGKEYTGRIVQCRSYKRRWLYIIY